MTAPSAQGRSSPPPPSESRPPAARRSRGGVFAPAARLTAAAFLVLIALGAAFIGPARAAEKELFSATLTVGTRTVGGNAHLGYSSFDRQGALSQRTFTYRTVTAEVVSLDYQVGGSLILEIDDSSGTIPSDGILGNSNFALHLGTASFAINNPGTSKSFSFNNHGLSWSTGNTVSVRLARTGFPGKPTLSATAAGPTQIDLTWTAPTDTGDTAITDYKIEVCAANCTDDANWSELDAGTVSTATTYSHTGLSLSDTRHYYRVSAINSVGTGAPSNVDDAATTQAPLTLVITPDGTFDDPVDVVSPFDITFTFSEAVTGFTQADILVHDPKLVTVVGAVSNFAGDGTTFTATVTVPTSDNYLVTVLAGAANAVSDNEASPQEQAVYRVTVPPPVLQSATVNGDQLVLTYNEALDAGSTPAGSDFGVQVGGTSRTVSTVVVSGSMVTLTLSAPVSHGETVTLAYTPGSNPIQDKAENDAGEIPTSSRRSVTNNTPAVAPGAPGAPRSLTATPGDGQVTLSWLAPSSAGDSAITRYDYRYKVGSGTFERWRSAGADLTETVGNLTNGQAHTFQVWAVNAGGNGPAASVTATPFGSPGVQPPGPGTAIWSATLTAEDLDGGNSGCTNGGDADELCSNASVLTDDDFTYDGTTYTVTIISVSVTDVFIKFNTALTATAVQALTLEVDGTPLAFANAGAGVADYMWQSTSVSWSVGDMVALKLIDTTPLPTPVLDFAVVNGTLVTLGFDKALDRTSPPDKSAFTAMVGGTAATVSKVSIPVDRHDRVVMWLEPPAMAGQTVTVGYTAPTDNPLQSATGVAVADFSGYLVGNETPPDAVGAGITLVDAAGRALEGTPPRLTVPEGGSAQFGFKLNTRPRHPVYVGFSHGEGDDDLKSGSSTVWVITVMPDDWVRPHLVTVTALQDTDNVDGERTFETFANSADPQYSVHPSFGRLTMVRSLKVVEADDDLQIGHATASPLAGFTLFDNADGGRDVAALAAGTALGARTSERLNIRAETRAGAEIGSVRLELSGAVSASRTENLAPYALFGDRGGRALPAGTYTVSATPYPEANLGGTPGPALSMSFTVAAGDTRGPSVEVTSRAAAPVSDRFEVTVRFSAPVTGLEISELAIANGRAMGIAGLTDADGRVTEYSVLVEPDTDAGGEVTVRVPAGVAADAAGNPNTASGTFRIAIAPRLRVTGFTLYDHETGSDVRGLSDGAELPAQSSSRLNLRAAASGPVASVRLELSGRAAASHTENAAPWYLFGDRGNRGARAFPAGSYTVTATPYPEANLGGAPGQVLSVSFTVKPHELSVADARAEEGTDATVDFQVTLAPSSPAAVTVEYATSDGTATAGADYTAKSGTLTFARGETVKTVSVAILDDSHDEGSETFTLTLSNASGASIADGTATGTIENADPMPQAWIARFGRTVAEQVVDSVQARLTAPRTPGVEVTLAGQRIGGSASGAGSGGRDGAAPGAAGERAEDMAAQARLAGLSDWLRGETGEDRARRLGSRTVSERDLLTGTSFALAAEAAGGGVAGLWGRGAITSFDGREGDLTLDGEVGSFMLGADWARDAWTAGLMLSHARGTGSYRGEGEGKVESDLTGLYPYGRYALNERVTLWGVAGYGAGSLTLTPKDKPAIETDMDLVMGAVGMRGVVVQAPPEGGPELAVKSDGLFVRTTSEAVRGSGESNTGNLAAAEADVTRLRLGLEGTWRGLKLGSGELTPRLEVGVRHDGGDAETGFGVDLGGGLAWSDPASGIAAEVSGRGLLTHEAGGFREQGYSGALTWDPRPDSDRGARLTLQQTLGASATGGMDALLGRETLAGLAANDNGEDALQRRRLEVRLGYGLSAFGDRFTSTPELGFGLSDTGRDYSLGWRLGLAQGGPTSLELRLEATRRESANDDAPEHGVGFRVTARW